MPAVKRPQARVSRPAKGPSRGARAAAAPRARKGAMPRMVLGAAATLLLGGAAIVVGSGGRGQAVASTIDVGMGRSFAKLGFRVARIEVRGASPFATALVLEAVNIPQGTPMLGVDLAQLRERVEKVGYVRSATVARLLPDTLAIAVTERTREAVWQHAGKIEVIDDHGQVIPEANAALFPALPMVVGEGANEQAADILPLVQARPKLMKRVEALVRVDGRRWDLRLKDGSLVQLPATGEDAALIQLDQLDAQARLLQLGFERIDLRDAQMVAVRPRGQPAPIPAAYAPKPVEPVAPAPAPVQTALAAPAAPAPVAQ